MAWFIQPRRNWFVLFLAGLTLAWGSVWLPCAYAQDEGAEDAETEELDPEEITRLIREQVEAQEAAAAAAAEEEAAAAEAAAAAAEEAAAAAAAANGEAGEEQPEQPAEGVQPNGEGPTTAPTAPTIRRRGPETSGATRERRRVDRGSLQSGPADKEPNQDAIRRLEELRRRRGAPTTPPGGRTTGGRGPSGAALLGGADTITVVEPGGEVEEVSEEYWFHYVDREWQDVVLDFANRLGKPLINVDEIAITGQLTYSTTKEFTKEEAIDELNFLLYYKGYHFHEERNRIWLLELNAMPRVLPLDRFYDSAEAYVAANLRPMEYAVVSVLVEDQSAAQALDQFSTMLPDALLPVVLDPTNQIRVQGVARDINRFLDLLASAKTDSFDPLNTRIFATKNNARTIKTLLEAVMPNSPKVYDPRTRKFTAAAQGSLSLTVDDRNNTLIARGTPRELDEVEKTLEIVDIEPDIGEFETHVETVRYCDAAEAANMINQILQAELGQSITTSRARTTAQARAAAARARAAAARNRNRPNQPNQPNQPGQQPPQPPTPPTVALTPQEILGEGTFEKVRKQIKVTALPRANSIAIYANEEGYARAKKLLEEIDVPKTANVTEVLLENVEVGDIFDLVSQLSQAMTSQMESGAKPTSLVPDHVKNAIYIFADPDVAQLLADTVKRLDEEHPVRERHVVTLVNKSPSEMMAVIQNALGAGGSTASNVRRVISRSRGRAAPRAVPTASSSTNGVQMIPLDDAQTLIVVCSDEEWVEVQEIIQIADAQSVSNTLVLEEFQLQHRDPGSILPLLQQFYRQYDKPPFPRTPVLMSAEGDSIFVQAIQPALDEIAALIGQLDKEPTAAETILVRPRYADATLLQSMLMEKFGAAGQAVRSRMRGVPALSNGNGPQIQVEPTTNSLVIEAKPELIAEIVEYINKIDDEVGRLQPERRTFDIVRGDPQTIAATVIEYFGGGAAASLGRFNPRGQASSSGGGVKVTPLEKRILVEAPAEMMADIADLVATLQDPAAYDEPVVIPYDLKFARAEDIQATVQSLLQAKIGEGGGAVANRFAPRMPSAGGAITVQVDSRTNTLLVSAVQKYQEFAAELIAMMDTDASTGEVVRIVPIVDVDVQELADILEEIVGESGGGGWNPWNRWGRQPAASSNKVSIIAYPATSTIVLKGLEEEVAEVERLIGDLAANVEVKEFKIFDVTYIDVDQARDLLTSIVSGATGGSSSRNMRGGRGWNPWGGMSSSSSSDDVMIEADEDQSRLYVSAKSKQMRIIETHLQLIDQPGDYDPIGGHVLYWVEVQRGDPWDIALEVSSLLPWDGPVVDADLYGDYVRVKCFPHEFPKIKELIDQFDAHAILEIQTVVLERGLTPEVEGLLLREMGSDIEIKDESAGGSGIEALIIDVWPEGQEPPVYRNKKQTKEKEAEERAEKEAASTQVTARYTPHRVASQSTSDADEKETSRTQVRPPTPAPPEREATTDDAGASKDDVATQGVVVRKLPDGRWIVTGPSNKVGRVRDTVDMLQEDLKVGEVLRIFKFKYGDVNAAAEILNRMFNESAAAAVARGIQQPQGRQQQPGQQGRNGQQGGQQSQQSQLYQQMQQMLAQQQQRAGGGRAFSGQRLRITTDPSRNYIFVKCEESDLDEIVQLLRILDDIPDVEVKVRVFQLESLDATETANNLSQVLGIAKARGAGAARQPAARGNAQQQQLYQMAEEMMFSAGEGGSAKIEQVEIVPNSTTNSLLVSAPEEVMSVIEDILEDLEGLEQLSNIVVEHYPLQNARIDEVLPLLQDIFAAAIGGGSRGGRPGAGGGASPSAMGAVNLFGDPRNNTITFTAEAKDVPRVRELIEQVDIPGGMYDADTYVCQYGDAQSIANAVSSIYGGGSGGGPRGQAQSTSTTQTRIVSEAATNTIIVWGAVDQRNLILAHIQELDGLAKPEYRVINVVYADAEDLALTLTQMFGGSAVTSTAALAGGGRRPQNVGAGAGGGIKILGDNSSKKLLVSAPDAIFDKIQEVVPLLDQDDQTMQIQRYQLKYADAASVVASLEEGLWKYFQTQQLGRGGAGTKMDAFTVVPDTRTNSIMVVGSEKTFLFISQIIASVDVPTPPEQRTAFRLFPLELADATRVADAINAMAIGVSGASMGGGAGGRGGAMRGAAGASAGSGSGELRVSAVADSASNTVMVFGVAEDIEEVATTVIRPFEQVLAERYTPETIQVVKATASQVASFVRQFLGDVAGGQSGETGGEGPHLVPNDNNNTIVVTGTAAQKDRIRNLVEQFDDPSLLTGQWKLIAVPYGRDVNELAATLESAVNSGEEELARMQQRDPQYIIVTADVHSNRLILSGSPTTFGLADSLARQLIDAGPPGYTSAIYRPANMTSETAKQIIEGLQKKSSSNSTGSSGVRRTSTGGRSTGGRTGGTNRTRQSGQRGGRRSSIEMLPSQRPAAIPGDETPARGGVLIASCFLAPVFGAQFVDDLMTDDAPAETPEARHERVPMRSATPVVKQEEPRESGFVVVGDAAPAVADATPRVATPRSYSPAQPRIIPVSHEPTPEADNEPQWDFEVEQAPPSVEPAAVEATADDPFDRLRQFAMADQASEPQRAPHRSTVSAPPAPVAEEPVAEEEPASDAETEAAPTETRGAPIASVPGFEALAGVQFRGEVTVEVLENGDVLIHGSEEDVALALAILKQIDESTEGIGVEVFSLKFAKAAAIVDSLTQAINSFVEAKGMTGSAAKYSITAEPRSNSLIAAAPPEIMDIAARVIDILDADVDQRITPQRIDLKYALAAEARAEIQKVVDRLNKVRQVPEEAQAQIVAIDRSNSLLIIGTEEDVKEIAKLVAAVDVDLLDEDSVSPQIGRMFIVNLANAQAEALATTLTDLITAEQEAARSAIGAEKPGAPAVRVLRMTGPDGETLPPLNLEKPIKILSEKQTNSLIVYSTEENNASLREIIAVFDTLPMGADTLVKAFTLKFAQAEKVTETLTKVFEDGKKALARPSEGGSTPSGSMPPLPPGEAGRGLPYQVALASDARTNTVFVIGRQDAVTLAGGLIDRMDRPGGELDQRFFTIPLKNVQASKLEEKVKSLLEERLAKIGDSPLDSAVIQSDDGANVLIVIATPDVFELVRQIAEELDASKPQRVAVTASYTLEYASASYVATVLQEQVDKTLAASKDTSLSGAEISIKAIDAMRLMVTASRGDQEIIGELIQFYDQPTEYDRTTAIIPLRRGDAEEMSQKIQEMFQSSGGDGPTVTVTFYSRTNALVVSGPPSILEDIERIADQLQNVEPTGVVDVQVFELTEVDAEFAGDLLTNIIEGGGGAVGADGGGSTSTADEAKSPIIQIREGIDVLRSRRDDIVITANIVSNTLIVTAPTESMPFIARLIAVIDVPPSQRTIAMFTLRNATATEMVDILETLFEEDETGGEDEDTRIVLGAAGGGGRQSIRFAADARSNTIVAVGTPGYLKTAQDLILEFDSKEPSEFKSWFYQPRNNTAEAIAAAITAYSDSQQSLLDELEDVSTERRLERRITANADADSNTVMLSYDPRRETEVRELLDTLDRKPLQVRIDVAIIEVTTSNSLELGVEWAIQDLAWTEAGPEDSTTFDMVAGTDIGASGSGLGGFSFTLQGKDFNFLLRTLQSQSDVRILSTPYITVMDNQTATIKNAQSVPFITGSTSSSSGTVSSVTREDVGITLEVTPQISPDGYVRLEIVQEANSVTADSVTVSQGVSQPITLERTTETTITVHDNETVVLGGLITSSDSRTESKVPILGDIPLLNLLFSYDADTNSRSELLVVLTPRIIWDAQDFREFSLESRDSSRIVAPEVWTDPSMFGMRLDPEDIAPRNQDEFGPFPQSEEQSDSEDDVYRLNLDANDDAQRARRQRVKRELTPDDDGYGLPSYVLEGRDN